MKVNCMNVVIYTDGSCLNNQNKTIKSVGGYGVVLLANELALKKEISGGIFDTTNVRAEMIAVIKGLEELKFSCNVVIFTDSELIVKTINNGWKKNKNLDLWDKIHGLMQNHHVKFKHVKGHSGNTNNEIANTLAQEASSKLAIKLAKDKPNVKTLRFE